LPPGTIFHLLYLQERLKTRPAGRFIEICPGVHVKSHICCSTEAGAVILLTLGINWGKIGSTSGKVVYTHRKIMRKVGQAVSAKLIAGFSGQYHGIFLEYLGI
jgi:hypothetical protein